MKPVSPVSSQCDLNMGVSPNVCIHCAQRAAVEAGGGDDDLVGRVTVKCARQLHGLGSDFRRKWQQQDAWIGEGFFQPLTDRKRQWQPT